MDHIYRGVRLKVCRYLMNRVDITFPEDWAEDLTVKDVVRLWLLAEGERR